MRYDELRPRLRTGDIVLFSGKGGISEIIKWLSNGKWSHVGMVVRAGPLALLWESTTLSSIPDMESGRKRQGVQLVALSDRLDSYDGEVAIRGIKTRLSPEQLTMLEQFRAEMKGRAYERDKIQLARAALDFGPDQAEDLSSLFCSELVAEAFQRIGLLGEDQPSNEFTPIDFSERRPWCADTHGPETPVTAPGRVAA